MYVFWVCCGLRPALLSVNMAQIQELYRDIDLSSHNASTKSPAWKYPDDQVPLNFIEREWTDLDRGVRERQDLLIRTIHEKSTTVEHVRHLKWTVLPDADRLWPSDVLHERLCTGDISDDEEIPAVYPPEDGRSFSYDF
jgi:hypothetical protein